MEHLNCTERRRKSEQKTRDNSYVGVYVLDGTELTCIKKAKRHDRSRPVSEMLLMMFRSAARDRRRICSEITQE